MNFRIIIGPAPFEFTSDPQAPVLQSLVNKASEFFASYKPKLIEKVPGNWGYTSIVFSAPADDDKVRLLLSELDRFAKTTTPPATAIFWETPEKDEEERVKFLEPYYYGHGVDENSSNGPLNKGLLLCTECRYPNLDHLPEPFLVNKKVLTKYDIYDTGICTLIVRLRVLKLLQEWVGGQILFGKAQIAKSPEQPSGDDALFWLRPKETVGELLWPTDGIETCPKCKRTNPIRISFPEKQSVAAGPGLLDGRSRFHPLGTHKLDIGLLHRRVGLWSWPAIVMSGSLLAKLKAHNVKGIVTSGDKEQPRCFFPDFGESPLEEKTAESTSLAEKPDLKPARKAVASLKDVPWDCTKDGYVYFHLTTPEFLVLDPMTWEEDSEGPYILEKFNGPGLYRLPVTAIKNTEGKKRGVTVDSATLVFIDNEFFEAFGENYEWDKSTTKKGAVSSKYYQALAEKIGSRFGVCTTPPQKFKSEFQGDGFYTIEAKLIEPASGS